MENKNGQGIFYGVIGVATLVVAIIGATFAYFSASASTEAGQIEGRTLGGSGGVLGLAVQKVTFSGATASSNDLVPTNISDQTTIQNAINANCESTASGESTGTKYTGCHLYTIDVSAQSEVSGAELALTELTVTGPSAANKAKWHYAIFDATESSGTYTLGQNALLASTPAAFEVTTGNEVTIFTNQTLASGGTAYSHTYYLLVYVENVETAQNAGDTNDVTGSYQGTISFTTSEGATVKATFASS